VIRTAARLLSLGVALLLAPPLALPRADEGSGWTTSYHGYAFLTSNRQGGPAAQRDFESENHLMVMSAHAWGGGTLSLLGTFTLEPATFPPEGVPELFQRGETFNGVLLVDRQHPHDLIAQIGAAWERPISAATSFRLYVAPRGEPAIGPEAYPHRLSASMNPTAPLAHHDQDSTHISADVVTAGISLSRFTLEGSGFHGREPDQNRWDLEQGRIDSYSGRVTCRATKSLSFQVSSAVRTHPEELEPGDQTRVTASGIYQRTLPGGFVAATVTAGKNQTPEGIEWGNSAEFLWKFRSAHHLYGRFEGVDRDLTELLTKRQRPAGVARGRTFVEAATIGYARSIHLLAEAETDLGADLTAYRYDSRLDAAYGDHPLSWHVFLKIAFGSHHGMDHMGHH